MVFGRRRRRSNYPLNIRHHGYCVRELSRAQRLRRYAGFLMGMYNQRPSARLRNLIIICFIGVRIVTGNRIALNPTFIRINRFLVDFSDSQLYHIRITNRNHIPRLIAALHIPEIVECENGSVMQGEEAFLLLLYWFSFPRCLSIAQEVYGLEYSQISRVIKAMIILIMIEWRHVIDDNFAYYVPRFALYSQAITAKYIELHGAMDQKYARTALMSDGTQRQHNRDRRTNYSGHKGYYCYGYLVTAVPDGMIADVTGAFAGRKNDHMKQNEGRLSQRLVECQVDNHGVPNAIQYDTNCDKGFHQQPCVNPMFNNLVNTPAQDNSNMRNSPIRVTNENINSLICSQWKLLDYRKVGLKCRQPLALYYKLGALLTNCLTCLDGNQVGEYFHCVPPTLEQYLV